MLKEELEYLVKSLKAIKAEQQSIEVKEANVDCPKIFDTLSAFSNQDNGGIIVFGVSESQNFEIIGVYNAQDLQKKVNEQCKQMEPIVRPLFTVCEIDGKVVVSAEIPSVEVAERPVFYKGRGKLKGSYIRVGESDEPMTEYEVYSYEIYRKRIKDDLRTVENATLAVLDEVLLKEYIQKVRYERQNLIDNVDDKTLLELMGVTKHGIPTIAGLMTFCKYPQAYFPQLCITAVSLPSNEMGKVGENDERFLDNKRICGSIKDMLNSAIDFVIKNSRIKTIIKADGQREDQPEYPVKAVREAILNALVHRDYSVYTENIPIRIEMYRDRLEIRNPGGIYGQISVDDLGKVKPETRNPSLANILEILKITENRYSGIPTINQEFKNAHLPKPTFLVVHGEFMVEMNNGLMIDMATDSTTVMDKVLSYCSKPRSRKELIEFTGFSRYYLTATILEPLLKSGKLKMTLPNVPKSKYQKYYRSN